jgi:hypothetical protein
VIQRVVRSNFGVFRKCYEDGLRADPWLMGRVSVRFVIGVDGLITNVGNGGSDMPDGRVVSCVVRGFYDLVFPKPEGGIVTVTYPIMFSPAAIEQGLKARVPAGMFQGCEASHGELSGGTEATIECEGYTVAFRDLPVPLTEARANATLGEIADGAQVERSSVGGVPGWTATAVESGVLWGKVVVVPAGDARHRVVLCRAKPPSARTQDACEQALVKLATAGWTDVLSR